MQLLDSFQQLCYYYISHPASPSLSLPFFLSLLYMLSSFMLSLAINTHTHRYSKQQRVCDTESGIEILVRQLKYVLYFFFFFSFSFFLFCSRTFLFSAFPYFMFSLSFTILPFLPACLRSFWLLLRVAACRLLELPLATHTHTHRHTESQAHTHLHTCANNRNLHKNKMKYEQGKGKNRTNPNANRREKAINMQ